MENGINFDTLIFFFFLSQEQAKEDETSLDFQLLPEELEQNPDELFELLEQRGQG